MYRYWQSCDLTTPRRMTGVRRVYQELRRGIENRIDIEWPPVYDSAKAKTATRNFLENPGLTAMRIPRCGIFVPDVIPLLEEGDEAKAIYKAEYAHIPAYEWVMVPSRWTRDTLIELLGVEADRIKVIPHGVDPVFVPRYVDREAWRERHRIPKGVKVVGHVSYGYARKNITRILEAVAELDNCVFVTNRENEEILLTAAKLGIARRVLFVPPMDDIALSEFYNAIDCFAFPSLFEGFGLPALEAQACACPTVLSNRGALLELAGPNAFPVNPLSVESIAKALSIAVEAHRVFPDPEWMAQFDWSNTTRAVAEWLS